MARTAYLLFGCCSVFLFLLFLLLPKKTKSAFLSLSLCSLFIAISFFSSFTRLLLPRKACTPYLETEISAQLSVVEIRYQYNYASSYLVQVESLDGTVCNEKAILNFEYNPDLRENDILNGRILVHDIESYSDHAVSYLSDGITLYLEPIETEQSEPSLVIVGQRSIDGFLPKIKNLNRALSEILTNGIAGEEGDLVSSLLLGNKELLSESVMRDFRRAGIIHILSISGMHLALMTLLSEFLLKKLRIHKGVRSVLVLFFAFFYLALTGFALSTMRAFIMTAFVYLSYLFRSDNDPLTSLFFALFFILLLFPEAVYDVGMWLSFSATFGILIAIELLRPLSSCLYDRLKNKKLFKPLNTLLSSIVVSFAASFCTFLPAWIFFDELSLLSIPATLLLSPLATFVLYLSPFFLLFSKIPYLSDMLVFLIRSACKLLLHGTSLLSRLPHSTVSLHYPFERILIPLATVVLAVLLLLPLRKKRAIPLSVLSITLIFFICLGSYQIQFKDKLTIEYMCDDNTEAFLITSADQTILCDISDGSSSGTYQALIRSKSYYATEIDTYILTHYHNLHLGSVRRLSEQTLVRKLFLPYPQTEDEYYIMLSLLELAETCGIPVTVFDRGEKLPLHTDFTLFVSDETYLTRSTHPTFYVAVQASDKLLLYLGESAHESERLAPQFSSLISSADAVIFGTHGPKAKVPFRYDLASVQNIFIADSNLLLHLQTTVPPNGNWIVGGKHLVMRIK